MYNVDDRDTVVERTEAPQSSIGAPCPMVLAGENCVHLAYYLEEPIAGWDGSTARMVDENSKDMPCALVRFSLPYAQMFGPPGDESFRAHPLAARGLRPYGVFEVRYSSWIRRLERMNSVHPYHDPRRFAAYKHFVFAFHDTTFECVAEGFELSVLRDSVSSALRASWPQG